MKIKVMDKVLSANDAWAEQNRRFLAQRGVTLINIIGSPGSGKTTLLERTIESLAVSYRQAVVEGDIATSRDAERIERKGIPVLQINTGSACHLDAHVVNSALEQLCAEQNIDMLYVENIGNLVCPAEFDIGEQAKVAVLSVTEGDDKIEKYPLLFSEAKVLVITKCDLLPYTNFNIAQAEKDFRALNAGAPFMVLDSISGNGFAQWLGFLSRMRDRTE